MRTLLAEFWSSTSGATAIEYGIMLVGIALVIVAAVSSVGTALNTTFTASAAGVNP